MSFSHKLGSNIRSHRESKGYSQEYIAAMLGICQSAYANLELGKTKITIERLVQIADILNTDIHQLIDTNGHQETPLSSETKEHYVSMIAELKNEIDFLRGLVKGA